MTKSPYGTLLRITLLGTSVLALAACDPDFRRFGNAGFETASAAGSATAARPAPDGRGIISYPSYQVAVARRGDTIDAVAQRIGLPAAELASYNAIAPGTALREGELLALPRRVAEPPSGPIAVAGGGIDVATIASSALDRADAGGASASVTPASTAPLAAEPVRHRVVRGETAYSISRLYNVNVRALADWNGLGPDLGVREGQTLLIPAALATPPAAPPVTVPGEGSPTPTPPSAAKPLPEEKTTPATAPVETPPAPNLGADATAASSGKLALPVQGKIIRGYQKKKNDGIDIAASAGTAVTAAGDGTVAAISKDTKGVPILVIRHADNLLTIYANIDDVKVAKGAKVKRGQTVATVRASDPAFLHFEVRQGFDSVDPVPYLQ
ncbi:MAG: peptidoglycan DD-metalloendopeptidase family protein [Paracoccaceae bacterium]